MTSKWQRAGITIGALLCASSFSGCTGPRTRETIDEKPATALVEPTPSARAADEVATAMVEVIEKKS